MRISIITSGFTERALNRLKYTLSFVNDHPFTPGEECFNLNNDAPVLIGYGLDEGVVKTIKKNGLFFERNNVPTHHIKIHEHTYQKIKLPLLSIHKEIDSFSDKETLHVDIFENIFFHISRYEEVFSTAENLDQYGRSFSISQVLVREGYEKNPVVDILVKALLQFCEIECLNPSQKVSISHDIDAIIKYQSILSLFRGLGGTIKRKGSIDQMIKLCKGYFAKKDPYDVYDWMMLDSDNFDKCIYLLVGGEHKLDTWYNLDQPLLDKIRTIAEERGYDIGLHPSMSSGSSLIKFNNEKLRLEAWLKRPVERSRLHFLKFSWPGSPEIIEKSGLEEDASLGFTDKVGFRCGTGVPYYLYNFTEEKPYNFLERPLICMDVSLIREADGVRKKMNDIIKTIQSSGATHLSFNFHNSRFFDAWLEGIPLKEIYHELFEIS